MLPDGCVDLIGEQLPGQAPLWKLSPLMDRACRVQAMPGQRYVGYRLRPGAHIQATALLRDVQGLELDDLARALERVDTWTRVDIPVEEALQALANTNHLQDAQHQMGMSDRSLQRLMVKTTGRPPLYWKRLARLRRAARALDGSCPLAQVAADHGFADQAHMNREFGHWLGMTPGQLRQQRAVRLLMNESGYG